MRLSEWRYQPRHVNSENPGYKDDEYKEEHREHYLREIQEDIQYVKGTFRAIQWKYFVDNKSPEQVAEEIARMLPEKIREKER